jgi:hypothetical protein
MQRQQSVCEMVEEVLGSQAKALAERNGQSLEGALEEVCGTDAGHQLRELGNGPHGHEKARDWQEDLVSERADERLRDLVASDALSHFAVERHYSWVENYMEWLEGKEARPEYHALLEEELASLRG